MKSYDYLISYNIKPSVQRIAIMDYLLAHKTHPSIDEIYLALCKDIPTLSKTTVYNTLKLFVEHGAALMLTIDEKNACFDGDTSLHAHFLCKKCGKIFDLPYSNEVKQVEQIDMNGFKVDEIHQYYKGKAPASKFNEMVETEGGLEFVDEHVIGVAKGCDEEMIKDLNNHFMGECTEVGMYLAMSRQADREGYPEVAEAFKRYAWEEAEHAAKFAELLGDCVWDTKTNLEKRMNAESGACADKKRIATRAKALNLDAIHDTVHEMAKDEARHGKGFEGLYNRYFKK